MTKNDLLGENCNNFTPIELKRQTIRKKIGRLSVLSCGASLILFCLPRDYNYYPSTTIVTRATHTPTHTRNTHIVLHLTATTTTPATYT